jgi:hypothetical protein
MAGMAPVRDPEIRKRMELAFDLYEAAEEIMRQNLRRRNPGASEEEIEEGIREWLRRRPGAEHGDGVGRLTSKLCRYRELTLDDSR